MLHAGLANLCTENERDLGVDIVEFNPQRDPLGITAMAAATFLKEIAARLLETGHPL